ncbi:MAG TPA: hypothetical protein VKA38_15405 [Draconibacterium sp.]|nr:hypothetical protein [Draconibacterium sp.]
MKKNLEKRLLFLFLFLLVVLQVILLILNEKTFGGADSVNHFQIARYAFKYPRLFLDLWGKPVYTTLSAPLALLGFKAAQLFNLAVAILTLWFVFKLSREFSPKSGLFAVILTAFAPVYFILMDTCLTEVLFSFVLIISVYFFIKNKFILSAVILSFIPFVRNEGIVFFPVFVVAYILIRSYRSIFFLAVGTLFYSLVGYLAFGDILWLIHRFPYPTGQSVYGSGSLFHFVKNSNFIFGVPFLVLLVIGLIYWLFEIFRKFSLRKRNVILFIVIAGSWITYFAAHSYVWWKGIGGSLGLTRVIGGVIPLAALTATKGIEFIFRKIKNTRIALVLIAVLVAAQVLMFFERNQVPSKLPPTDILIKESAEYIQENHLKGKVFYFNPMVAFHLRLDPYDHSKSSWGVGDKLKPSNSMDYGDIIVWDAHFGPNEGRTSLASLQNDPQLQLLKTLLPVQKIQVLGGYDYGVYIFQKVKKRTNQQEATVLERNLGIATSVAPQIVTRNGVKALELEPSSEYSPSIVINMDELAKKEIVDVALTVEFESDMEIAEKEVLLIISVENGRDNLRYEKLSLT